MSSKHTWRIKLAIIFVLFSMIIAACKGDSDNNNSDDDEPTTEANVPTQTSTASVDSEDGFAALVNDEPITLERLEIEMNAQSATRDQVADLETFRTEVLEQLIDLVLLRQFAATNNIIITDEEIENEIAELNTIAAENDQTLTDIVGYPETMIEQKVYDLLITQAVLEHIINQLPETTTQVHARHILVKSEQAALDILEQLDDGADFAELAREFSKDGSTAPAGGDLGWIAEGDLLQPEVESIIFSMPDSSRWPEPVGSILGYHVIESLERVNDRPLTPQQEIERQQRAYDEFLAQQRESAIIIRYLGHYADDQN
jgi:parvulin-like peptidyl-prolyl isomerase